jgi:hypothetical protein
MRATMSIRRSLAALLFVASFAPSAALAQSPEDIATARQLTLDGYASLDAKDFGKAADLFKRADALYHAPTITLGLARAYAALGRLVAAQEAYSKTAHETVPANASAAFTKAVADAQAELATISPRVPGVVINVKGPADAKVTLDGNPVPSAALGVRRAVDPGTHVVKVIAPGHFPGEAKVTVAEGKVETITVEIKPDPNAPKEPVAPPPGPPVKGGAATQPPPPPAPPPSGLPKTLGFVGVGVGGAGLILGAVTGGLALSKHSSLVTACGSDGHCAPSQEKALSGDVSAYKTMGAISTAGFIAGGALAVTGVVLLVTAPKAQKTGSITPLIGPGYLGAEGRF